jgi:long-chain acyl-CoA synthetase
MASISDTFYSHARSRGSKPAIVAEDRALTYEALADLVRRWASVMAARGVRRGDHVGVLLPNSVECVALMLVAADLGVVLVPLSTSLPAPAVHRAFVAGDVRHVVGTVSTLGGLVSSSACDFAFADGLWLSVDGPVHHAESLAPMLATARTDSRTPGDVEDDDPFILTMTSGSTGDPKPIVLTQRTKFNRAAAAVELYGVSSEDRVLAATPLYHSLAERLVLIPLLNGGTSILMARFSASEWLRWVSEHGVTFTIAVSSQLRQIGQQLTTARQERLATLRCVVSSSALLETHVKTELLDRLRCDFHECYGASEIAIASNLDPQAAREKTSSVGTAAPGVDIKILGENGQPVPTGEPGEIVCETPMIFGGYFKRPDLTRQAMWGNHFRTGDVGRLDGDGFLYFLGRQKDIIITGGINAYPADIESVIESHPSVAECAVFAMPDERLGEVVAAAIVPSDSGRLDQRAIRFHCAEHLADFQQPRRYFVVEGLPRNSMGKIMRRALVTQFAEGSNVCKS